MSTKVVGVQATMPPLSPRKTVAARPTTTIQQLTAYQQEDKVSDLTAFELRPAPKGSGEATCKVAPSLSATSATGLPHAHQN